ncbi:MAG: DUF1844 domain-containing protein [Candidatus Omnitrophica bacterium]|nr:DUF1844 domain-containing protein [Candidatus Omnitrophota bacterium]
MTEENKELGEETLSFLNYIASLAFQAMIFLGEVPSPITNQVEKNVVQAKLLIDTLSMLKEKTAGNLTDEEDNLLNGVLYELHLKYVDVSQKEQGKIITEL